MIPDRKYNIAAGNWSDDTSMTIATLNLIILKKGLMKTTFQINF